MRPVDVGTRLELFVDDFLIDETRGVERRLNRPEPQAVVLRHDDPWEGKLSTYHSVFEDGGTYRMYYRARGPGTGVKTAYAESEDGLDWEKPSLGTYSFEGSTENNVVTDSLPGNAALWKDRNPDRDPDEAYKALGKGDGWVLEAYTSPDGFDWSPVAENPVMTAGAFDTHNTAFWDPVRGEYRSYTRDFDNEGDNETVPDDERERIVAQSRRVVQTATSEDFRTWTDPTPLSYPAAPEEQLYTNCVGPYYRAPHIFLGFPMRYVERDPDAESLRRLPGWELRERLVGEKGRQGFAVTDTLFMASRDGHTFTRWPTAFLRPGLWREDSTASWFYGSNGAGWQLVETASATPGKPRELSLYVTEHYRGGPGVTDPEDRGASRVRRYSLRIDGFVSVEAPLGGGELVTRPLTFGGDELVVNYATSAAGALRVELQRPDGTPYEGFAAAASPELFGDDLERGVEWAGGRSAGELAGEPVRVRFVMSDADLYSFRFRPTT